MIIRIAFWLSMLINLILYLNFFAIFLKLIIRIAFYLSILINLIFFAKKIFMCKMKFWKFALISVVLFGCVLFPMFSTFRWCLRCVTNRDWQSWCILVYLFTYENIYICMYTIQWQLAEIATSTCYVLSHPSSVGLKKSKFFSRLDLPTLVFSLMSCFNSTWLSPAVAL